MRGCAPEVSAQEKALVGWVENVTIPEAGVTLKAKLDTGAKTSSLDASSIKLIERDNGRWVQFLLTDPETGENIVMKEKRERGVKIIRHSGKHQRRHVVDMDVCVAGRRHNIEFSLIDRSNFIYPVLLGRSALDRINLVIDPESTFLSDPDCPTSDDK